MEEKTYTEAQLKAAVKSAFNSGVSWAEAYVSWFKPTQKDTAKKFTAALRDAKVAAEQCVQRTVLTHSPTCAIVQSLVADCNCGFSKSHTR